MASTDTSISQPDLSQAAAPLQQRFSVAFEYPVLFTRQLLHPDNTTLLYAVTRREPQLQHRLVVVIDHGVAHHHPQLADDFQRYVAHHAARLQLLAAPRILPGGEACKNDPATLEALQQWLHDAHVDRHACIVIVGGGALLDMAGYAAATAHRGIRTLRVPTTVLAQNDSGVGVKTAVNAFGAKNYLGSFAPPFAVINDYDFIATLPPRDRIAGMAEAVKVAAIRDLIFFHWLQQNSAALRRGEATAMQWLIRRCAELHLQHIGTAGDPFEFGSARPLDFGHWAAHKLESMSNYHVSHGEAVAIGLALDSHYSVQCGLLDRPSAHQLCQLLHALGFCLWHPLLEQRDPQGQRLLLQGLAEFREHLGGELTITLLQALGRGVEVHQIDPQQMEAAIACLQQEVALPCA